MMKPSQFKDALRNIGKQKISYLSVIVIALLGATTFLGINYSDGALRRNGSILYNAVNFRDVEIVSTLLLTDEDLDSIRSVDGVADAEAVWQTGAKTASGKTRQDVNVISLTERINLPQLVEGRLPETAGECAVEGRLAEEMGWQLGDELQTLDAKGQTAPYLTRDRFVITGIANHPDHTSISIPDTLYVLVTKDAFDTNALSGSFMKAEVVVEKPEGIDRFTKAYDAAVDPVMERLEETAQFCTQRRAEALQAQAEAMLADGQAQLDEAKMQLDEARGQLDEAWGALSDGEEQLNAAEQELSKAQEQLDEAENTLWATKQKLQQGGALLQEKQQNLSLAETVLDAARKELDAREAEVYAPLKALEAQIGAYEDDLGELGARLADARERFSSIHAQLSAEDSEELRQALALAGEAVERLEAQYAAVETQLRTTKSQWNELHAQNAEAFREISVIEAAYFDLYGEYLEAQLAYTDAEQQYKTALDAYNLGLYQWYEGREQLTEKRAQFKTGETELNSKRVELESGEGEYARKLSEYEDAVARLTEAASSGEVNVAGSWLLLNCRSNSSFVQLLLGSSNLTSLEMTFSMLFVVIGALVIYATISKMIDEQRGLVGAGKALGLFNREVFAKYLLFGVSGTLTGILAGTLIARFWMEVYVLKNAGSFYTFDTTTPTLIVAPTVIVFIAGLLLAVSATWFACGKLLRSSAVELMQARVPAGRKKEAKGRGHVLSLYTRLILLNIRSDLRRVLVTVVSVAGCCALVVIGFTLKAAVEGALEKQYANIVAYDARIKYDTQAAENADAVIRSLLDAEGVSYTELSDTVVTFRVTEKLVGELLCGDVEEISSFYHLLDWKTEQPLVPVEKGIYVQKRTAESYNLQVGSELEISLDNMQSAKVTVAGIFNNYIGRTMVMSAAYYRELFGSDSLPNAYYIRLNGADDEALLERLREIEGFDSYTRSDADKSLFASSSALVTAVVALFIFMAAVMAGVVLTNLTNTYILQKNTELTIMRINGFTVREVIAYVARETVFTTVLGILFGLAAGSALAYNIIRSMESAFIQYDRSLSPVAWVYGVLITGVFAIVINVLALRKVRHLKLTDIN